MKCHYEVLALAQDADDAQIKSAYRRLALKWHPDKNLDNSELAKTEFQLVQQAYEILSDRQERAWYDKHREQILCGSNAEYKDSNLNIFEYFTTSCFKGYGDDENGFYTIYSKVFEDIIQDDIQSMLKKDQLFEAPAFGASTSDYEDVVAPFYDYWMSYTTTKSFVWLDNFNIQEVRDRRILKLIEKDHKKVRQKAKKEWNDEVRALVAFVRKRDKRVKEYSKILQAKLLENRQKNEEISKQKRLERKKMLDDSVTTEAEWTKFDNVKTELEQIEKNLAEEFGEQVSEPEEDEDDAVDVNNCYCVACNKVFKSPKAFQNHELSKKHKENIIKLKEEMDDEDVTEEQCNSFADDDEINDNLTMDEEEEEKSNLTPNSPKRRKKQKKSNMPTTCVSEEDLNILLKPETVEDDFKFEPSKKKTKNKRSKINGVIQDLHISTMEAVNNSNSVETVAEDEKPVTVMKKTKNNKKAKENDVGSQNIDSSNYCVTCRADFPSKNKLFAHLKKTGHSVLKPQPGNSVKHKIVKP